MTICSLFIDDIEPGENDPELIKNIGGYIQTTQIHLSDPTKYLA
jgi:hypothetical protein